MQAILMVIILCDSKALILFRKFSDTIFLADANCIQIRAPLFGSNVEGANFEHGEHVGHVAKECAAVLAKLMDAGFEAITATPSVNSDYIIDYQFSAMLSYTDTNRSKLGYDIDIIVHSNKSASWVDAMFLFLHHQGFEPVMMI